MKEESKSEWISVSDQNPPDETVQVLDDKGNEGYGNPTYYPFKINKGLGKRSSTIETCEPYWDGGWIIPANERLKSQLTGKITHWREFNFNHK
jgi:hypothetical protein